MGIWHQINKNIEKCLLVNENNLMTFLRIVHCVLKLREFPSQYCTTIFCRKYVSSPLCIPIFAQNWSSKNNLQRKKFPVLRLGGASVLLWIYCCTTTSSKKYVTSETVVRFRRCVDYNHYYGGHVNENDFVSKVTALNWRVKGDKLMTYTHELDCNKNFFYCTLLFETNY